MRWLERTGRGEGQSFPEVSLVLWALFVWAYALAWFLVNDWVKLAAYRIFDREQPGLLARAARN